MLEIFGFDTGSMAGRRIDDIVIKHTRHGDRREEPTIESKGFLFNAQLFGEFGFREAPKSGRYNRQVAGRNKFP